jgi:hypothetical protein
MYKNDEDKEFKALKKRYLDAVIQLLELPDCTEVRFHIRRIAEFYGMGFFENALSETEEFIYERRY